MVIQSMDFAGFDSIPKNMGYISLELWKVSAVILLIRFSRLSIQTGEPWVFIITIIIGNRGWIIVQIIRRFRNKFVTHVYWKMRFWTTFLAIHVCLYQIVYFVYMCWER